MNKKIKAEFLPGVEGGPVGGELPLLTKRLRAIVAEHATGRQACTADDQGRGAPEQLARPRCSHR